MKHVCLLMITLGLAALTGCNFNPGIPVTPTLIPTLPPLPSERPSPRTAVVVLLPSATFTLPSIPLTPSIMPSLTLLFTLTSVPPTASSTPTIMATATNTDTQLPTDLPTLTPTETQTPQSTDTAIPLTLVPTDVPTDLPSATGAPITATLLPTVTVSITLAPDSSVITATLLPTFTAALGENPTLVSTTIAPIMAKTPLNLAQYLSMTPGTPLAQVVPISPAAPLQTPFVGNANTPAAIAALPTALSIFAQNGTIGRLLVFPPTDSAGNAVGDVDVNSTGHVAAIDAAGHLTIDGGSYDGDGHKHARQVFKLARWSPDGNWLAYIVETPNAEVDHLSEVTANDDGVWIVQPGGAPIHVFLNVYQAGDAHFRVATGITWSPDSAALIITARIYQNDQASFLVGLGRNVQDDMSLIADGGAAWLDANSLVAVKSLGNPGVTLGILNLTGQLVSAIGDGAALHYWMQNPTQLPDGRYAFLGKPSITGRLENGPTQLSLYTLTPGNTTLVQVSAPIAGPILAAAWNPANTILLVMVQTDQGVRTKAMTLDGAIVDIGPGDIHWKR